MATAFAMSDYAAALLQGSALPPAELDRVATRMVQLIGLPKEQIVARNLRIDMEEYRTALLKDQGLVIGRLDSRVTAPVPRDQPNRPSEANDPALPLGANNMIVSDVMGDYMRNDLKVQTTRDYISLTLQVNFNWDWQVDAESSTAAKLLANIKSLMLKNPRAQLLLVGGYYDLAAPVLSSRYAITHAGLPMNRVKMVALETGHSAFEGEEGRKQMRTLLSDFLAKH
jgi:carboxypeptidase C (cathepsin A)